MVGLSNCNRWILFRRQRRLCGQKCRHRPERPHIKASPYIKRRLTAKLWLRMKLWSKRNVAQERNCCQNAVLAKVESSPSTLKQTANRQREQTALGSELNAEPVLNLADHSEPSFFEEEVSSLPSSSPVMIVAQVSLTPEQLAQKPCNARKSDGKQ